MLGTWYRGQRADHHGNAPTSATLKRSAYLQPAGHCAQTTVIINVCVTVTVTLLGLVELTELCQ